MHCEQVGATGIYQAAEMYSQLHGVAGPNQVENAQVCVYMYMCMYACIC